ncbi:alanine racemase [Methyloceanibacter sp.]|uniref:alanine racemase n=1 Tax=Methyloceanibacter sp. TaxID=1965321 RepID=UPI003D6C9C30
MSPARPRGETSNSPVDADESAVLTIDLDALVANYRHLRDLAGSAECAAVVKADAYGLGMARAAPALWRAGCKTFFVATLGEAEDLRALLPDVVIYVFSGLLPGMADAYRASAVRPVLNSADEIREWAEFCARIGEKLPCAVHIDSGMNRLGLSAADVDAVEQASDLWPGLALSLVMSHLACADEPEHQKNIAQRMTFDSLRARLPQTLASLANSAGILLGPDFAYDLVRPGIALYGGHPQRRGPNPFRAVVHLNGRILQVRDVPPGETVGYGATRTLKRRSRIAVVSVGYADGLFRTLSRADGEEGPVGYIGAHPVPILGRVSMDLITMDVTGVPESLSHRGAWVEILGPNVSAHELAAHAGTIDYEVLTSLSRRALRRYIGG